MESYASPQSVPSWHLLIPAAGSGSRLGGAVPKQYVKIYGKSILRHTLEAFLDIPGLQSLRVIIDSTAEELYRESVQGLNLPPPAFGGKNRKQSVFNGINGFFNLRNEERLLIHDAARPFVSKEEILSVIKVLEGSPAVSLAVPVSDTLRRQDGPYVDRNGLWALQTPQGFYYGVIRQAHEKATPNAPATDDTSLVAALGIPVTLVEGRRSNFKITTMDDFEMAEQLMRGMKPMETRTGMGFDVHAFTAPGVKKSVRLCGVDIPHDRGLEGHSDADAGLHAVTDALLGALAAGDIGQHFPPSDPQWKGVDSAVFLKKAVDMVAACGGRIINVDVTLICEAPKIGPHREAMQKRVAEICGLTPERVGIKATTTEKLGFTGRKEGLAAQAVATVSIPA